MTTTIDAAFTVAWMNAAATALDEACPLLTELDAARGDADHGVNMQRGFAAIAAQLEQEPPATAGDALLSAAKVLRRTMGGTSGPLWSAALRRAGKTLSEDRTPSAKRSPRRPPRSPRSAARPRATTPCSTPCSPPPPPRNASWGRARRFGTPCSLPPTRPTPARPPQRHALPPKAGLRISASAAS